MIDLDSCKIKLQLPTPHHSMPGKDRSLRQIVVVPLLGALQRAKRAHIKLTPIFLAPGLHLRRTCTTLPGYCLDQI